MLCTFGDFQHECENLIALLNLHDLHVESIEDLRSGTIISHLLSKVHRKPELLSFSPGSSKTSIKLRWAHILKYIEIYHPKSTIDFKVAEIIKDVGILAVTVRSILKLLHKPRTYSPRRRPRPKHLLLLPPSSVGRGKDVEISCYLSSDEDKLQVHRWLQELRVVPPGVLMHEFLYRVRSGLSLYEVLKKVDEDVEDIEGIHLNPVSMTDCIKNIAKLLRFLKGIKGMNKRCVYCSAYIYEGNQEIIYGLLVDIRAVYTEREKRGGFRNPYMISPEKSIKKPRIGFELTSVMKNSLIEWVGSLNLLHYLYVNEEIPKNTVKNGILVCKVIEKIYSCHLQLVDNCTNEKHCIYNLNLALEFLLQQEAHKNKPLARITKASEEAGWELLWEIMNNSNEELDKESFSFREKEKKVLAWLENLEILSTPMKSLFELVPFCQNGVLPCEILKKLLPDTEFSFISSPTTEQDSFSNINSLNAVLKAQPLFNQRYTHKTLELYKGDLVVCIGLLQDLYYFSQIVPKTEKILTYNATVTKDPENFLDPAEITQWLNQIGVKATGLFDSPSKDFRNGLKLIEIVQKVCSVEFYDIIMMPKTNFDALHNVNKALHCIYAFFQFPLKYRYADDLILQGDTNTIKSLLSDLKYVSSQY